MASGGQIIVKHVYDLIITVKEFMQRRRKVYDPYSPQSKVSKRLFVTTLIGLIFLFIVVTSYFISQMYDFTFGDSLYYSCITLFTIGFGDVHQSNMFEQDGIGKSVGLAVFMFLWLVIGLS